jgi:hypothetical protein
MAFQMMTRVFESDLQNFLIIAVVLVLGFLIIKGFGIGFESGEEEVIAGDPEAAIQQIAEYRTYMVNQLVCLIAFWLKVQPQELQTKLLTPQFNQNVVIIYYENFEVTASFFWETYTVLIKTSIYSDEGEYIEDQKAFNISNNIFENEKLYNFINAAIVRYRNETEVTVEDLGYIIQQLKIQAEGFESEDAAKTYLFNYMSDLMLLMRRKKNRNNKKLMHTFAGLVYWLWNVYGNEFLEFLDISEDELSATDLYEDEENIEGNE